MTVASLTFVSPFIYLKMAMTFFSHRQRPQKWYGDAVLLLILPQITVTTCTFSAFPGPRVRLGHPSSPLVHLLHLFPFYFSLSFSGLIYFLLLSIPSLSTRIVPRRFQAGGRRRRPNLGLVCVLFCNLCYLYSLVKMDCGVLFYLV